MIRTIIIDDEQHCIDRLKHLLNEHCTSSVELTGVFQVFEEGVTAIKKLQPDLLFLDVQLQDKTGFDLLQQFNEINFEVIFTTAHVLDPARCWRVRTIDG